LSSTIVAGFTEMGFQRLAQKAIHADDPAPVVRRQGLVEPGEHAPAAFGRDAHDLIGCQSMVMHELPVDRDEQPARECVFIGEMIDRRFEATARMGMDVIVLVSVARIVVRHGGLSPGNPRAP
jgi:hypothetical protein